VEAVICAIALRHGFLPGGVGTRTLDPSLRCNYLLKNQEQAITHALSNSFGFGGSNCSLLFSRKTA
jgi:3-oxoacyl-[acyl-carrier-protein] synthase-1